MNVRGIPSNIFLRKMEDNDGSDEDVIRNEFTSPIPP